MSYGINSSKVQRKVRGLSSKVKTYKKGLAGARKRGAKGKRNKGRRKTG